MRQFPEHCFVMWINDDVDIPEALLTAQRDGRLVVFAGAGVSMGPPSNLPGFADLATQIAAGLLTPADNEAFDVFLGRVASLPVDVQKSARQRLNLPGSTHRQLHSLIIDLFRSEDDVRIVTTNFDPHFTTALRARYPNVDIFNAPALPLGRDFSGLVYVHGSLARREPLVLTDMDFGRAYLIDGYATRFLTEMFAEYVVLFVGHSHRDVVMQYMTRAFIRAKDRFAFSTAEEPPRWKQLGITPIVTGTGSRTNPPSPDALRSTCKPIHRRPVGFRCRERAAQRPDGRRTPIGYFSLWAVRPSWSAR